MRWTREAIAARVRALRREHAGPPLVAALEEFGKQLDESERAVLGEILLEHARAERPSLANVRRDSWLRRQLNPPTRRR